MVRVEIQGHAAVSLQEPRGLVARRQKRAALLVVVLFVSQQGSLVGVPAKGFCG